MKLFSITLMVSFLFVVFTFINLTAQTNWTKHEGNPVLTYGPAGTWNEDEVYAPCVIKEGDTLKMWYTGANGSGIDQIGYATSTDGTLWQEYTGNPVLRIGSAGSWDSQLVVHPEVIFDGSTYHMWYGGSSDINWYNFDVGYATSQDGIHWTKYDDPSTTTAPYHQSDPVLKRGDSGEWDDATFAGVTCISDGDTIRMWYSGCDGDDWANARIGYATSTDGIHWEEYIKNPIFNGSGTWELDRVFTPFIMADSSGYKMWYAGFDKIGYATSDDGISWDPLTTPVLSNATSGWDNNWVAQPSVLIDDTLYYMWYSGGTSTSGGRIGYAFEPIDALQEMDLSQFPENLVLNQNYPNPFNPSTTIEFTLPKSELITLKVYNILGKEVTTLVSNKLNQGNHTYQFDGRNLASGIYYYQLVAGDYREVKKMILLR